MKFLLAAVLSLFVVGPTPKLTVALVPAQTITVSNIDPQAVGACTIYTSLDEKLDGQPYAPRHCWFFDNDAKASDNYQYQDDWSFIPTGHSYDVSAEIYIDSPDGGPVTTTSNIVKGVWHQ